MPSEQKANAEPPKGFLGMFGSALLKSNASRADSTSSTKKATQENKDGEWQTVKRKQLALKASRLGLPVSIQETLQPKSIPEDNDVEMGIGKRIKRNRKRFSPYGARGDRGQAKPKGMGLEPLNKVDILVAGFRPGTENELISFLQIKSKKTWEPLDAKLEQGQMLLTVSDPIIARSITRLHGYLFGSDQLQIRLFDEIEPNSTCEHTTRKLTTIDHLRTFLQSRWNGPSNFLNLEHMSSDPVLKKAGIKAPGTPGSNATIGPAMFKLAGEMFGEVFTVSFANNRLQNVKPISTITQFLPSIQNLSLKDNLIKDYTCIEPLSGTGKLTHLRELLLIGNPVHETNVKKRGSSQNYVRNIVRRFPTLALLDGAPIVLSEEDVESIRLRSRVLPLDTKGNSFDNEISQATTFDFLSRFYPLFDDKEKRTTLESLYDTNASFSVSSLIKLRGKSKVKRREKKAMMDADIVEVTWKAASRNFAVTSSSEKSIGKGLLRGPEAIVRMLRQLPPTIHDFNNPREYVVDGYQHAAGLQITLHGEFKENANDAPYSYDRIFLLRQAAPGSRAMAAGWPYTILSDMLVVRDYAGYQAFQPQVPAAQSIFDSMPPLSMPPITI